MPLFCLVMYRIKILNHARLTKTLFVDKQMSRCMQLKTSRYQQAPNHGLFVYGADTRKAKHGAKHGAKHDAKREAKHEAKLETLAYTQGKTKRNTLLSATWVRFPVGASFLNLIQEFFFTFLYRIYKFYVIYIQYQMCI